jgi:hypothetical protein
MLCVGINLLLLRLLLRLLLLKLLLRLLFLWTVAFRAKPMERQTSEKQPARLLNLIIW